MEVLINNADTQNSAWYQFRPVLEKEVIVIKPEKEKTKRFFKKKTKQFRNILPRISVKMVKAKVFTQLGTTIGANLGYVRIN